MMYGRDGTHVNKRTHERKKKEKEKVFEGREARRSLCLDRQAFGNSISFTRQGFCGEVCGTRTSHGGALGINLRNGKGPRELSFLFQDRRVPTRRPLLPPPQPPHNLPNPPPFQHVSAPRHDHSWRRRPGPAHRPSQDSGTLRGLLRGHFRRAQQVRRNRMLKRLR